MGCIVPLPYPLHVAIDEITFEGDLCGGYIERVDELLKHGYLGKRLVTIAWLGMP